MTEPSVQRRQARRSALILGAVAMVVFVAFITATALRAGGAG